MEKILIVILEACDFKLCEVHEVKRRCIKRNNNEKFIERLEEIFELYYQDSIRRNYEKLYILKGSMTLEDCFLADGILLKK